MSISCSKCGKECKPEGCSTGYGENSKGEKVCFACCAETDRAEMIETGRATLYLSKRKEAPVREKGVYLGCDYEVTNWPGTLRLPVLGMTIGRHNFAGRTYKVRLRGPDGKLWTGIQFGDNTQICRVRRSK